jgi:hypothetical protein
MKLTPHMESFLAAIREEPARQITKTYRTTCTGMFLAGGRLYPPRVVHALERRGLVRVTRTTERGAPRVVEVREVPKP